MNNIATGPIPGQSLTREPGNATFEQPPQFTDFDDAMEYLLPRILNPETGIKIGDLMEKGLPATSIADSLLIQGFSEGKWTPDLAVQLATPLFAAVIKAAELGGYKTKTGFEDEYTYEPDSALMALAREDTGDGAGDDPEAEAPAPVERKGIMSKPSNMEGMLNG
jgi:hypothetical protein